MRFGFLAGWREEKAWNQTNNQKWLLQEMNSTGRISWKPWHPFSEVKWLESSWYDVKSAENPELPPYILSWEGCFKQNMMIWNFPPFLQNTNVVAASPWQMLSIPFHIVQEGFPWSQSPFGRPKWAQDVFWTFLEVVLSSISGWSGVKISLLWGAPPAATHPKGFVFIWEFPETFTCHCFCWSIPHHNWNTCFFRSYNLSS